MSEVIVMVRVRVSGSVIVSVMLSVRLGLGLGLVLIRILLINLSSRLCLYAGCTLVSKSAGFKQGSQYQVHT